MAEGYHPRKSGAEGPRRVLPFRSKRVRCRKAGAVLRAVISVATAGAEGAAAPAGSSQKILVSARPIRSAP